MIIQSAEARKSKNEKLRLPGSETGFSRCARGNALHELPEEFASDEFYQLRSLDSDCVNESITVTSRLPPMLPIRTRHQNADRGQSRFGRGRYGWAGSNIEGMADESPAIEFDSVVEFKNALIGLVNRAACAVVGQDFVVTVVS
jgi:hypothetical protein